MDVDRTARKLAREVVGENLHVSGEDDEFCACLLDKVEERCLLEGFGFGRHRQVDEADILGLGDEARMNRPGTTEGNWEWRLLPEQATEQAMQEFSEVTGIYGRR